MAHDPLKALTSASAPNAENLPKIQSIFDFNAESLGQLRTWLEQNPPAIPVTQIIGFNQFTAVSATARNSSTVDTTTSTTYVDLTNVGPTLTGLADGKYVLLFGGRAKIATAGSAVMSPNINSTTPNDDDFAATESTVFTTVMRVLAKSLSAGGNNTVKIQYRSSGPTASFAETWLVALRYSNL